MDQKVREALRAGRYDRTEEGVYVPDYNVLAQGVFVYNKRGEAEEFARNRVVDQGLDFLLKAAINETASIANWYIALFQNDTTVLANWTAANFEANASEWQGYDEATRGDWNQAAVASGGTDSFSNKASFTSSGDGQVVRGAALLSASAKGSTAGVMLAASRLTSDKTLATGEILDVGYGIQLTAV